MRPLDAKHPRTLTHAAVLGWLTVFSFFSTRWLWWSQGEGISVEGAYFGVMFAITSAYLCYFAAFHGPIMDRLLGVHLGLIILAGVTLLWSLAWLQGIKEWIALLYVWMFHFLFRNLPSTRGAQVYDRLFMIMFSYLLITLVSISIGYTSGAFELLPDQGREIADTPGVFIMPLDLVSVITFVALTGLVSGERKLLHSIALVFAIALLLLNFSKTYMVATAVGWLAYLVLRSATIGRSMLILTLAVVLLIPLVFTTNRFTEQLFFDRNITLATFLSAPALHADAIDTSGRVNIWAYLYEQALHTPASKWLGAGLGSTNHILATNPFGVAGLAAHSDYARLGADFGILGVATYLVALSFLGRRFLLLMRRSTDRFAARLNGAGFMTTVYLAVGGLGYEMLNRHRSLLLVYFAFIALSSLTASRRRQTFPLPRPNQSLRESVGNEIRT